MILSSSSTTTFITYTKYRIRVDGCTLLSLFLMMQAFVVVNVPVCDESVKSQKEDVQYSFHMLIHYLSYDGLKLLTFLEGIHISNQNLKDF